MAIKSRLVFDEIDERNDARPELPVFFRPGDTLVIEEAYYKIEHAQFDVSDVEATYWLAPAAEFHPSAPETPST